MKLVTRNVNFQPDHEKRILQEAKGKDRSFSYILRKVLDEYFKLKKRKGSKKPGA